MRNTEEKKLREYPAAQRGWDMQVEAKINNTTPNGKVKKSLSSGSLSTEAGGPSTSARKTIVDASSVAEAGARGRSPGGESRSTERRPRRRVRDRSISSRGSRSSNERIKKKEKVGDRQPHCDGHLLAHGGVDKAVQMQDEAANQTRNEI